MTRIDHAAANDSRRRCAHIVRIVATHKGISRAQILSPTRSRSAVASARQLAMYLCHVLLELNFTEVGRCFGRDRTTVAHACALMEDARDDWRIDAEIQALEQQIAAWVQDGGVPAREGVCHATV